jgi:Dyp-type peroxidase family
MPGADGSGMAQPLSELEPLKQGAVGSDLHDLAGTTASSAATTRPTRPELDDAVPLWNEFGPSGTSPHDLPAEMKADAKADDDAQWDDGASQPPRLPAPPMPGMPAMPAMPPMLDGLQLRGGDAPASELEIPADLPRARGDETPSVPPGVVLPSRPPTAGPRPRVEPGVTQAHPGQADLHDIQGLVYHSWADHPFAAYQFARLGEASHARAWLAQVRKQVTPSLVNKARAGRLQLALSPRGLAALGVPSAVVAQLPHEARAGMRARARVLGDDATSEWTLGGNDELDVLVMMFARDEGSRAAMVEQQRAALQAAGAVLSPVELSAPMPEQREHFGFVDGISQPFIHGLHPAPRTGHDAIAAGELVLGYPNEYERLPHSPRWDDVDLGRNGSYLVFRKLEQHVERFWGYLTERGRALSQQPDDDEDVRQQAEYLAAKMMGRWPSGAPMATAPHRDDPAERHPDRINTFGYRDEDAEGLRCPISSHVRRANPRDSHGGSADESRKVISRHRILRRGRSWGPPLPEELARAGKGDQRERGLYFISLQTSIARGFEFIQQSWLNNQGFGRLNGESDPLTGAGCPFTIPAEPVRLRLPVMPRVVTTRGGGYFFLPSISALARIARG